MMQIQSFNDCSTIVIQAIRPGRVKHGYIVTFIAMLLAQKYMKFNQVGERKRKLYTLLPYTAKTSVYI